MSSKQVKAILIARSRWQYYAATVGGSVLFIGVVTWSIIHGIVSGFDLSSIILLPIGALGLIQGIISVISSMKDVEVTSKGLTVSYLVQKHQNVINFSDVFEVKTRYRGRESMMRARNTTDTFILVMKDGRSFEFTKSQFTDYKKFKDICQREVGR